MALSLLTVNACNYPSCGLHFANLYDLIAHMELDHIPVIEAEQERKSRESTEDNRSTSAPNMPMSCVQRFFSTPPPRPVPCKPEVFRISFNHYRKRNTNNTNNSASHTSLASTPVKQDDDVSMDSTISEDLEECASNDPENRFRCQIAECGRRYKNRSALRYHMRQIHSMVINEDTRGAVVTAEGVAGGTTTTAAVPASPSKAANTRPHKCPHCSKRYKTTSGLSNHMTHAHQKQLSGTSQSAEEAQSPSQDVVDKLITQARQHGLAVAEQQRATVAGARPLPVALAQNQNMGQQSYGHSQAPLPVRSVQVSSGNRYQSHMHPSQLSQTTGQMLQQQMNQRRMIAQQQQQMHHEQQQHQQHHQHQSMQSMPQQTQQQMNMQQQQQMHPRMQLQQQFQQPQQQQIQQQQMYQQQIQYVAAEDGQNMINNGSQQQQLGQPMMPVQLQQGDGAQVHSSYSIASRVPEMEQRRYMAPPQQQVSSDNEPMETDDAM